MGVATTDRRVAEEPRPGTEGQRPGAEERSRDAPERLPDDERPAPDGNAYAPFPNIDGRNLLQSRLEVPAFVRALRLPPRAAVLEVGCGRGVALPVLGRLLRPSRLVGLDIEPTVLDVAEERAAGAGTAVELVEGDVRSLPFATASFDVVIDFGTCYHIARSEEAISEIARVLATGGLFATETKAAQLLSHPVRTMGRRLPLEAAPALRLRRHAVLWAAYVRADGRTEL
jgi:SAM-dependent methyltransferase